jgi:ribonuclease Z
MFKLAKSSVLLIFTALLGACGDMAVGLLERVAEKRIGVDLTHELEDGLHAILCGAGSPMADPKRSGPCVAIVAGDTLLVVDAGTGGARQMGVLQLPLGNVDAVLLTHFHSDHIDGLGELSTLRWVQGANDKPLPVYGPTGVEDIVQGFNMAYARDAVYRNDHHGDTVAPLAGKGMVSKAFTTPNARDRELVFEMNGLKVTVFSVPHEPVSPSVAYRFDYKGRSIVVSGDTSKSENLQKHAQGVDLLIHEALAPQLVNAIGRAAGKAGNATAEKIMHDIPDYHTSPVEAAEIAEAAGVGHLLYYHIVPALLAPGLESVFLQGVNEAYNGPVTVGEDGTMVSLPANSKIIEASQL